MNGKRDFYEILGVGRNASDEDIKKAYKRLAKEYHPDVAKNKAEAEKRFKEINEAYQVLSNKEKRRLYDQLGHAGVNQNSASSKGSWGPFTYTYSSKGPFDFGDFADPFDIFEQAFGFRGFGGSRKPKKGKNLFYSIKIPFAESVTGSSKEININGRKISIKIPPGVRAGTEMRFAGEGERGPGGLPPGDLYLKILVDENPKFARDGADAYSREKISITQAALGDVIIVESLDPKSPTGVKSVKLKIPPGTQPNTTFRLRNHGFPRLRRGGRGDHYVQVVVEIPKKLSRRQKSLLKELAETL